MLPLSVSDLASVQRGFTWLLAGRVGLPTQPAYCASKYAVEAYSDILRKDMLAWGVTVHIIEPGVFSKTGLYNSFQTGLDEKWKELNPELKEAYGEEYYKFVRGNMGAALADFGNTNSELVPLAMIDGKGNAILTEKVVYLMCDTVTALTSSKPKYRYRVGHDSKYMMTVIERLHESTQDFLLTISKQKEVSPAGAPKNGKAIATSRYDKDWPRFLIICAVLFYVVRKLRK